MIGSNSTVFANVSPLIPVMTCPICVSPALLFTYFYIDSFKNLNTLKVRLLYNFNWQIRMESNKWKVIQIIYNGNKIMLFAS